MTAQQGTPTHDELLVLRALAEPGTRWHQLADLHAATGLYVRTVKSALRTLSHHGRATGPPEQPFPKWSITTVGEQALAQAEVAADVRLEEVGP